MVTLHEGKQFIINNDHIASAEEAAKLSEEAAKKETLTWQVLSKHNHSDNMEHLEIQFDSARNGPGRGRFPHRLCRNPSDCLCERTQGVPDAVCIYQLP